MNQTANTKKVVILGMLAAVSYVLMVVGRIPVVLFLKYDPKDVIITIGGFLYGPISAMVVSLVVSLVEMFTVSDTGPIGLLMNVLSTCAFSCTAAFIYKKKRTLQGAVIGLISGCVLMTAVMLLWNYLITPIYLGYPREDVAAMLLPAFLPFNLLKSGLNAAITMLLYKPLVTGLRYAGLVSPSQNPVGDNGTNQMKINLGIILVSLVVLVTCILLVLVLRGVL